MSILPFRKHVLETRLHQLVRSADQLQTIDLIELLSYLCQAQQPQALADKLDIKTLLCEIPLKHAKKM